MNYDEKSLKVLKIICDCRFRKFYSLQYYETKVYFESHVVTAAEQLLMVICVLCISFHTFQETGETVL